MGRGVFWLRFSTFPPSPFPRSILVTVLDFSTHTILSCVGIEIKTWMLGFFFLARKYFFFRKRKLSFFDNSYIGKNHLSSRGLFGSTSPFPLSLPPPNFGLDNVCVDHSLAICRYYRSSQPPHQSSLRGEGGRGRY